LRNSPVESGKNSDRPELEKALSLCRLYHAKLVVAKLDRASRNLKFLATLMDDGVEFVCCDMLSANKLAIHILAAVAQAEAEMISARTKAALGPASMRRLMVSSEIHSFNVCFLIHR